MTRGSPFRRARRNGVVESVQLRAWARAELARITPPGWVTKRVDPWKSDPGTCRACDAGVEWTKTMLTKLVPGQRTVLYAFALVCTKCVGEPEKLQALGNRVLVAPP